MKLSELTFLRELKDEPPVLILDDVLSELDDSRQRLLLESMQQCQCFLTCTSLEGVKRRLNDIKVFRCVSGTMEEE